MGHGDVRHRGRDVLAVVEQRDDAGVQTLEAPAIMLKKNFSYPHFKDIAQSANFWHVLDVLSPILSEVKFGSLSRENVISHY